MTEATGKIVFDRRSYPERGHGMVFKDRYLFEEAVPLHISKGEHRLGITSLNSHGLWGFNIRFSDHDGYPDKALGFSLPKR